MTKEEGKARFKDLGDADNWYYYQTKVGWFDAQKDRCDCHPEMSTYGRKINHSKKNPNLKPVLCQMQLNPGEKKSYVILFQAMRKIEVNEELLFDYAVHMRSFGGEAKGMDWLTKS